MGHAAFPGPLLSNRAGYLYTQQSCLVEVFSGHLCFRRAEQHLLQPPAQRVRPSHWQGSSGSRHQTITHGPNHHPGKEAEGWRQSQTCAFSPARFSWVFTVRTGCVKAKTFAASVITENGRSVHTVIVCVFFLARKTLESKQSHKLMYRLKE